MLKRRRGSCVIAAKHAAIVAAFLLIGIPSMIELFCDPHPTPTSTFLYHRLSYRTTLHYLIVFSSFFLLCSLCLSHPVSLALSLLRALFVTLSFSPSVVHLSPSLFSPPLLSVSLSVSLSLSLMGSLTHLHVHVCAEASNRTNLSTAISYHQISTSACCSESCRQK